MATKLSKTEKAKTKADFDPPKKESKLAARIRADKEAAEARKKEAPPVVVQMTKAKDVKSEQMSVKLYPDSYKAFCEINRIKGMSNNSAVNMLIADYIKQNKDLLE